jgi:ribosomal protein L37AE/L43A
MKGEAYHIGKIGWTDATNGSGSQIWTCPNCEHTVACHTHIEEPGRSEEETAMTVDAHAHAY